MSVADQNGFADKPRDLLENHLTKHNVMHAVANLYVPGFGGLLLGINKLLQRPAVNAERVADGKKKLFKI